jgi:hypothetical protein
VTSQEYRFASDSSLSRQAQKLQLWGRFGAFATPRQMTGICVLGSAGSMTRLNGTEVNPRLALANDKFPTKYRYH